MKPVIQNERRIPFALRDKVDKEIEQLVWEDINEDITGQPTHWLNQLVIVPKGDNIHICVKPIRQLPVLDTPHPKLRIY